MSVGGSDHYLAGRTYVGPRYEVVGGFPESLHNRMLHDFVWDIEAVRVLDKGPTWFASTRISTDCDVGIQFRDNPTPSILRLYRDSLEEKIHCGHETLLGPGAAVPYQTFPVAMQDCNQFAVRDGRRGAGGSLSSKSGNASVALVGVGTV